MKEFKICFTDEKHAVYLYNLIYDTGTTAILNRDSILIIEAELVIANENGFAFKLLDQSTVSLSKNQIVFAIVKDI